MEDIFEEVSELIHGDYNRQINTPYEEAYASDLQEAATLFLEQYPYEAFNEADAGLW